MKRLLPFTIVVFALGVFVQHSSDATAADQEVVAAVHSAIPYLEREGVAWMEKRGCVSCHQIPFMIWSLSAAQQAGFDVDPQKLKEWRQWSTDVVNFVKPEQKENVDTAKTMSVNIDTMAAMLLAGDDQPASEWRISFAQSLAKNQNKNGSWKSCGQLPLQKREKKETNSVTAAWTVLSLQSQGFDKFDSHAAMKVVDATSEAKSTEWWTARLLLAHQLGEVQVTSLQTELLNRQNDDGGWGWITTDKSDALATGMAVYALSVSGNGEPSVKPALEKAQAMLISTQTDDGSWAVPGTKKATQKKTTPTANYWGTAWAVIGLLELRE